MDWVELLQRFGFPIVMVGVLCMAIFLVSRWVGKNVATPLVQGHLSFLCQLQTYLGEHTTLKKSHIQLTEKIQDAIRLQGELLREIHAKVGKGGSCNYPPAGHSKHPPS